MAKAINNSKAKLEAFEKANEVLVPVPLSQPTPLINAIAELGNFTPPPPNPPTIAPAVATIPYGYPIIQAQTIESGGLPVQRLETNGLFNLVSTFIKYWSQGGATKFDTTFGIAPGQGYTRGSVLYYADPTNTNNILNGWYTKLNNNVDTTALPNVNWKRITGLPVSNADSSTTVPATSLQFIGATVTADTTNANKAIVTIPTPSTAQPLLFQQGRLTGVQGSPYGDTSSSGSPNLYFTPTYDGNLISLWNGTNWVTQTFSETTQNLSTYPDGIYDIFITSSSTSATGITITLIGWSGNPPAPANRQQASNARWIYTNSQISILVGSINVSGGVVKSYYGIRGIWNLYNQVPLLSQIYIYNGGVSWIPPASTTIQTFKIPRPSTAGTDSSQIGLLIDPLVKDVNISYSGQTYGGSGVNTRFSVSFGINNTTPVHPITSVTGSTALFRNGANTDAVNVTNTIEFYFNITDVTKVPVSRDTTTAGNGFTNKSIVGYTNIVRLESQGYPTTPASFDVSISDNNGLTVEYLG